MSNITKSNREHSFDAELAEIVGVEKAILLKSLSMYNSLNDLVRLHPYFTRASVSRWVGELEVDGWILVTRSPGKVNLYSTGHRFSRFINAVNVSFGNPHFSPAVSFSAQNESK